MEKQIFLSIISIKKDFNAKITMTLSTKACPLHQMIVQWVEEAVLRECEEVQNVEVEVVWEPAWNISMATDEVKKKLSGL